MADEYRIPDLIFKKRNGHQLSTAEIEYFIQGVAKHCVQDAQLGAMLMAMVLVGLDNTETIDLTGSMVNSGLKLEWPDEWRGKIVDKHSTGGVGDKISLVLAPALAACGMKVPMVSGRGLGHTGGTLDKLESIPGFSVSKTHEEMVNILEKTGCCIVGQTDALVPADKIMYATRDVTATVDNIGLISASIMSKKVAENVDSLVLDVKCGKGAMMKAKKDAVELANRMVAIGNGLGIKTLALLTSMDAPIGKMVGNALEVAEAIHCLNGHGPYDLLELVVKLGGHLLNASGNAESVENGYAQIESSLTGDCKALQQFRNMIIEQGVSTADADSLCARDANVWNILPKSKYETLFECNITGFVHEIDALKCAHVSGMLGAGRAKSSDKINFGVGIELLVEVGDTISKGNPWIRLYHDSETVPNNIKDILEKAIIIQPEKPENAPNSRLLEVIQSEG